MELPSGKRIHYERDSTDLTKLRIDGRTWDLRDGAVFQIKQEGPIVQRPAYPPLLREENVREWLETIQE